MFSYGFIPNDGILNVYDVLTRAVFRLNAITNIKYTEIVIIFGDFPSFFNLLY